MASTETLKLKNGGAAKAAPSANAEKAGKIFEAAKAKSLDVKKDQGKENPPRWRALGGKDYSGMKMIDIFSSGVIKNGDFRNANLDGADFTFYESQREGVDPLGGNKTSDRLKGFILQGCDFRGASLAGTNFACCDLRWATFVGSDTSTMLLGDLDDEGNVINEANFKETDGLTR